MEKILSKKLSHEDGPTLFFMHLFFFKPTYQPLGKWPDKQLFNLKWP